MTAKKKLVKAKPTRKSAKSAKRAVKPHGQRADYGAAIDGFIRKQPQPQRSILEALRELAKEVSPDAKASLKWGMPFYMLDGAMMCAFGAHKAHVNLILVGPPDAFPDPHRRLEGKGKGGRHLKMKSLTELPRKEVRAWLRIAAEYAKEAKS